MRQARILISFWIAADQHRQQYLHRNTSWSRRKFFCSIQQGKYTFRAIVRRRRRHRRRRRRRRSVLDWLFSDAVIFFIHRAIQAVL